jgi:hypothetical protein
MEPPAESAGRAIARYANSRIRPLATKARHVSLTARYSETDEASDGGFAVLPQDLLEMIDRDHEALAYANAELTYTLDVERYRVRLEGGAEELSDVALRVTTIFRRESDGWKIVHRHADPITTLRPATSMVAE